MFYTELIMSQVAALKVVYPWLSTADAIRNEHARGFLTASQRDEWIRVLGL